MKYEGETGYKGDKGDKEDKGAEEAQGEGAQYRKNTYHSPLQPSAFSIQHSAFTLVYRTSLYGDRDSCKLKKYFTFRYD